MTSSALPEVHSILHDRQKRTEPPPHVNTYSLDKWFYRATLG